MILYIIAYVFIASIVTAAVGVVYERGTFGDLPPPAAIVGAFWLPVAVGAIGFFLLIGVPYRLTQLLLDKLRKVC